MGHFSNINNSSPSRPVPLRPARPIPVAVVWRCFRNPRRLLFCNRPQKLGYDAMSEWKKCPRCGKLLPLGAFGRDSNSASGLRSWCRECANARSRELYDPQKAKRRHEEYIQKRPDIYAEKYISTHIDLIHERASFHNSIEMEEIDSLNEKFNLSFGGYQNDEE